MVGAGCGRVAALVVRIGRDDVGGEAMAPRLVRLGEHAGVVEHRGEQVLHRRDGHVDAAHLHDVVEPPEHLEVGAVQPSHVVGHDPSVDERLIRRHRVAEVAARQGRARERDPSHPGRVRLQDRRRDARQGDAVVELTAARLGHAVRRDRGDLRVEEAVEQRTRRPRTAEQHHLVRTQRPEPVRVVEQARGLRRHERGVRGQRRVEPPGRGGELGRVERGRTAHRAEHHGLDLRDQRPHQHLQPPDARDGQRQQPRRRAAEVLVRRMRRRQQRGRRAAAPRAAARSSRSSRAPRRCPAPRTCCRPRRARRRATGRRRTRCPRGRSRGRGRARRGRRAARRARSPHRRGRAPPRGARAVAGRRRRPRPAWSHAAA